jgi:hypothetical protein
MRDPSPLLILVGVLCLCIDLLPFALWFWILWKCYWLDRGAAALCRGLLEPWQRVVPK